MQTTINGDACSRGIWAVSIAHKQNVYPFHCHKVGQTLRTRPMTHAMLTPCCAPIIAATIAAIIAGCIGPSHALQHLAHRNIIEFAFMVVELMKRHGRIAIVTINP